MGGRLGDVCSGGGGGLEVVVDPHAPQGDPVEKADHLEPVDREIWWSCDHHQKRPQLSAKQALSVSHVRDWVRIQKPCARLCLSTVRYGLNGITGSLWS